MCRPELACDTKRRTRHTWCPTTPFPMAEYALVLPGQALDAGLARRRYVSCTSSYTRRTLGRYPMGAHKQLPLQGLQHSRIAPYEHTNIGRRSSR